jgi:hypothetical protein
MRTRAVVAFVLLLLPAALSAQRIPLPVIGRRGPGQPEPLPPQPTPIARELAYKRWRLSVESYPLISYVQSPGMTGVGALASWTTFGTGTRADYLLTRNISATLDLTSSFVGGPAIVNTAELGTRLHPEWAEHRLYPFVDLRVGYFSAYNKSLGNTGAFYADPIADGGYAFRYSRGFGAIGGVGAEYALTRTWSLTTGASVVRSQLMSQGLNDPQANRSFGMTTYRYTLGARYNPVRVVQVPGGDVR